MLNEFIQSVFLSQTEVQHKRYQKRESYFGKFPYVETSNPDVRRRD